MATEIDINRIERQTRMVLHEDGLDEILVGLTLGVMAVFFLDSRLSIALVAGCIIQILVKPACRRRLTYPRVGYAKLKEMGGHAPSPAKLVIAVGLVAVGLGLFFVSAIRWLLPPYLGIVLAAVTFVQARRTAHAYDYVIVGLFLVSGLLGLLLISLGCDPGLAVAIQGWALAGLLIPVGAVRLALFLRKHPRSTEEPDFDEE
jgi:hypothetical protein